MAATVMSYFQRYNMSSQSRRRQQVPLLSAETQHMSHCSAKASEKSVELFKF